MKKNLFKITNISFLVYYIFCLLIIIINLTSIINEVNREEITNILLFMFLALLFNFQFAILTAVSIINVVLLLYIKTTKNYKLIIIISILFLITSAFNFVLFIFSILYFITYLNMKDKKSLV